MKFRDRECVPNVSKFRKMILEDEHRNKLSILPRATDIY